MSEEYKAWLTQAKRVASSEGVKLPDEGVLETMYEDGLEPEDSIATEVQARYGHTAKRRGGTSGDVREILHRLATPD